MGNAHGLGPAVSGTDADCPTCKRKAPRKCARKATKKDVCGSAWLRVGDWVGESKRCHPARITAAIEARQARERGTTCP